MKRTKRICLVSILCVFILISLIVLTSCDNNSNSSEGALPLDSSTQSEVSNAITTDNGDLKFIERNGNYLVAASNKDMSGSLTIPSSYNGKLVKEVSWYAFRNCTSLTSVTISDSVTTIGDYAFDGCTSLTSITIPNSVTEIGSSAFEKTAITSITIPSSVTSLGSAFKNCTALKNVILNCNIEGIWQQTFFGCTSLTEITLPDGLKTVDGYAFNKCTALKNITIPGSITEIRSNAFNNCTALETICFEGTEEQWNAVTRGDDAFPSSVKIVCSKN